MLKRQPQRQDHPKRLKIFIQHEVSEKAPGGLGNGKPRRHSRATFGNCRPGLTREQFISTLCWGGHLLHTASSFLLSAVQRRELVAVARFCNRATWLSVGECYIRMELGNGGLIIHRLKGSLSSMLALWLCSYPLESSFLCSPNGSETCSTWCVNKILTPAC